MVAASRPLSPALLLVARSLAGLHPRPVAAAAAAAAAAAMPTPPRVSARAP